MHYVLLSSHNLKCFIVFFTILALPFFTNAQAKEFSKSQFAKVRNLEGLKIKCILKDAYGFMWFGTETGLYRYDGYNTELINANTENIHLSSDLVLSLYEDSKNNLWIGTDNGLQELSADHKTIKTYLASAKNSESKKSIYAIAEMHDGSLWCSSDDGYLYRSADKKSFTRIQSSFISGYKNTLRIALYITEDNEHNVWTADKLYGFQKLNLNGKELNNFSTVNLKHGIACYADKSTCLYADQQKIYAYSKKTNAFTPLVKDELFGLLKNPVQYIYQDRKGFQWLVTQNKLIRFNPITKQVDDFTQQFMNSGAIFFQINCMYEDANEQLWFGSYFGAYKLNNQKNIFKIISPLQAIKSNDFFSTRGIVELDSSLFIGSYYGFFKYNKTLNQFTEYKLKQNNSWINPFVRAVVKDTNNNLWLATEENGLLYFDTRSHNFTNYFNKATDSLKNRSSVISANNYSLLKDNDGQLWLGGYNNLYTLNPNNGKTELYTWRQEKKSLPPLKIMAIYQSRDKSIWLCTDNGLYCIKKNKDVVAHYTSFTQNFINCIYEDSRGWLWLGTLGGGVNVLNPVNGKITEVFTETEGLADDKVCAILPDTNNELWISTYNGLSCLNLKNKSFRNFYTGDGLSSNEFNQGSALAATNGKLYFGSVDGIISFNPKELTSQAEESQVMLTKLVQHNGEKNKIEETTLGIHALKNIRLNYKDRFFTVYFVIKDYFESANNRCRFAYKLDGITDEWQDIGATNYIQIAGLPAGNYILRIKGMGSNGIWGKELNIPVKAEQAFYATTGAYILYFLIAFSIVGIIYWFQISKIRLQNQLQLEQVHQEKLQELDEMKSRFFTNITHEFRTPLTLIQGPAEKILNESDDARAKRWAAIIRKNSRQLLHLINQLLDLSRIEAGQEKLQLTYADLVLFTKEAALLLQSLAEEKKIKLHFETSMPFFNMLFDQDKLGKALYNLLVNAIRYTNENGNVTVDVSKLISTTNKITEEHAVITVQDTGIGIAAEHLPNIFNRYYRIENSQSHAIKGTGIGLALVKEFVELHKGKVEVSSVPGQGSVFTITLPISTQLPGLQPITKSSPSSFRSYAEADLSSQFASEKHLPIDSEKDLTKPVVLIAEDHEEIRAYIRDILLPGYQVLETANGVTGVQLARETIPDLIISDIMMPEMDGNMLCLLLKQDERTSHIPIILLTAKAGQANRIQGLQSGADAYLSKPFDEQELLLHVKNLLHLRRQIAAQIMRNYPAPLPESAVSSMEKSFLERFAAIVDAHIDDEEFGVEKMLKQIGMSRTQLHRKLKAVTGLSAGNLIRVIRLQRALELLQKNEFTISEIAYKTGFSSPSYFTESFHKHFGYPPREVNKKT